MVRRPVAAIKMTLSVFQKKIFLKGVFLKAYLKTFRSPVGGSKSVAA